MQTSIEKEIRINQPYWRKTNSSLSPEERQSWLDEQEEARKSLAGRKRLIPVRMVEDYLKRLGAGGDDLISKPVGSGSDEIDPADHEVHPALVSCRVLRIPFQTVVDGKLPDDPRLAKADEDITVLRRTDLGLDKVATPGDVAEYFRNLRDREGAQVVVFRGLRKAAHMVKEIRFKGVNVTLEGAYGNRVATFRNLTAPKKRGRTPKNNRETKASANWQQRIDKEFRINDPYWAKLEKDLIPADAAALLETLQRAHMELIQALLDNGGMFDAGQIADYLAGKEGPTSLVGRAVETCTTLRIPFQCVAATSVPASLGCSKAVEDFRQMDLGLPKFDGFGPMAEHFLSGKGDFAVLSAGPKSLVKARKRANNNRIVVQVSGAYGNRLVRYVREDDFVIQARHERERSRRNLEANDDRFIFSNRYHEFAEGKPVYVEENYSTLMREVRKKFGPGSCTTSPSANKKGRNVTLNSFTKPGETN